MTKAYVYGMKNEMELQNIEWGKHAIHVGNGMIVFEDQSEYESFYHLVYAESQNEFERYRNKKEIDRFVNDLPMIYM